VSGTLMALTANTRRDDAGGGKANGNAILNPSEDTGHVERYVEAAVAVLVAMGIDRAKIIELLNRICAGLADKQ
jgi:hypothetical protein